MKQLFKAVDSLDGKLSWFFFDGVGNQTISSVFPHETVESITNYHHEKGADWPERENSRGRMINPELIAEWE